jgi:intergrase/recombinase
MTNQIKAIGLVIRDILKEKKISVSTAANSKGMTRQGVYAMFSRVSMTNEEIGEWADLLSVSIEYIQERTKAVENQNSIELKKDFGSETLERIERLLQQELREKNEQIRALQESLLESQKLASALLGKLHEYSVSPVVSKEAKILIVQAFA